MGRHNTSPDVKCPYYRMHNGQYHDGLFYISCEGLIGKSVVKTFFRSGKDYKLQLKTRCMADYWNCPICEALDVKYMDKE